MGKPGVDKKDCSKCKRGTMTWTRFNDANRLDAWFCDECGAEDRVWQRMKSPDGRTGKTLAKRRARARSKKR